MKNILTAILLFGAINVFSQTLETRHETVRLSSKDSYDSLAYSIHARQDFIIHRDTTKIYDINDPSKVIGFFIARYYTYPNARIAKIETYGYNRPYAKFYFKDDLLFMVRIDSTNDEQRFFYYTDEINNAAVDLHRRLALLYPDTKSYWDNLELGKLLLMALRRK